MEDIKASARATALAMRAAILREISDIIDGTQVEYDEMGEPDFSRTLDTLAFRLRYRAEELDKMQ